MRFPVDLWVPGLDGISPSGNKGEWRGEVKGQTCENERDVQRGVGKYNRTYTSQRGHGHVENRLRETGYERGEKS